MGPQLSTSQIAEKIRDHVIPLCADGDRHPGTERNRAATGYVSSAMREIGLTVEELPFEVPEWRFDSSTLSAGSREFDVHAGPFSAGVDARGRLAVATSAAELAELDATGCVLLLRGPVAAEQFTARGYPFYDNPEHAGILDALEASGAIAIVAATDKNPMTAGMSPFPLIEEPGFALPHAYLHAEQGALLAQHEGEEVSVRIASDTVASTGMQPVGRREPGRPGGAAARIVVGAHIDSKPETPGALDNACGVAVMLAAAELLGGAELAREVEFVPFNGEDHVLAPGELAYLAGRSMSEVSLMVNIDGAGLPGSPSAYSHYNADERLIGVLERLSERNPGVVLGEPWPASDHMIFAMQGIPSVAITSLDFETASGVYAHTPRDTAEVPDYELLAHTARFVADLLAEVGR